MKRLDINITSRLDDVLEALKQETELSKTELVHNAVALLYWAKQVHDRGHAVGEIDPTTATVLTIFSTPVLESAKSREKTAPSVHGASEQETKAPVRA